MPDREQPEQPAVDSGEILVEQWPEDVITPDARARTRSITAKGAFLVGARAVAGTIGLAVAAATVAAASILPLPAHEVTPPSASVVPVPAAQVRACAGPLLRLGDDSGSAATQVNAIGAPTVSFASSAGNVEESQLQSADTSSERAATVLTVLPDIGETSALLSGTQSQTVGGQEVAGFAAAECAEARTESWLVGGATDTGRTTIVTLGNPGTVAATVNLTIFSIEGEVEAPGAEGIVVQPGGERILSLAGLAPGLVSPVVRVRTTVGQIVANLQQSTVRTLDAGGVDIIGPTQPPSKSNVITGLSFSDHERLEDRLGDPGYQDLQAVMRFFVPGEQAATAQITVDPEDEAGEDRVVEFELVAGQVTELPLDEFPDGRYTVTVESDVPIVAGARVSTVSETGVTDFAWLGAAPKLRGTSVVSVAPGPGPAMHLANPTGSDAVVTIDAASGADQKVTVPAGESISVEISGSASYTLDGFDELRVAVSYVAGGQNSGFTVSPTGPASEPITVFP